jgi:putative Holliday junction resolvase
MLLRNPSEFIALIPKHSCLLGLDYGTKAIGVAVSDPNLQIASPIGTINRTQFPADAAALQALMRDRTIGGIIMGLPKNLEGGSSAMAQAARAFMRNLVQEKIIGPELPLLFWDERFSTAAVQRMLIEGDMTRKRREEVIDKMAAAYILQGALDAIHHSNP